MNFTGFHYRLEKEHHENILRYAENERLAQIVRAASTPNDYFVVRPRRWVGVTLAAWRCCRSWLVGFKGTPQQITKRSES